MLIRNILPAVKADSAAPHERAVLHLARRRGLLRSRDVAATGNTDRNTDPPGARGEARANRPWHLYAGWSTRQCPSLIGRGVAACAARRDLPALGLARARNRNTGAVRGLAGAAARACVPPRLASTRDSRGPHVPRVTDCGRRPASRSTASAFPSSTPPRPLPTASSFATRSGSMLRWRRCVRDGVSARSASMTFGSTPV